MGGTNNSDLGGTMNRDEVALLERRIQKMMQNIKWAFEKSKTGDKDERYQAYHDILNATDQEVTWAYEVWDQLLEDLTHKDNHQRSRAAQYLAGLAKSDPDKRIMTDYPQLWSSDIR